LEEQEDIAGIEALPREEYENAVSEEAIIADYEAKYGWIVYTTSLLLISSGITIVSIFITFPN
jgi:hypothetical protein